MKNLDNWLKLPHVFSRLKLNTALPREIPLYDDDGETVIGSFIVVEDYAKLTLHI